MLSLLTQAFPKQSTLFLAQAACSESSLSSNYLYREGQHRQLGLLHLQESCPVNSTVSVSWSPALACLGIGVRPSSSALAHLWLNCLPTSATCVALSWKGEKPEQVQVMRRKLYGLPLVSCLYYLCICITTFYRGNFSWACELIWEQCLVFAEPTDKNADGSFNSTSTVCHRQLRKSVWRSTLTASLLTTMAYCPHTRDLLSALSSAVCHKLSS